MTSLSLVNKQRVKLILFPLLLILLLVSVVCKDTGVDIKDHTVIIKGTVADNLTGVLLDDVIVGFKWPEANDSTLLKVLTGSDRNGNTIWHFTESTGGQYEYNEFLGVWPPVYENMFAYKDGYQLWKWSEQETRVHIRSYTDSLNIEMVPE